MSESWNEKPDASVFALLAEWCEKQDRLLLGLIADQATDAGVPQEMADAIRRGPELWMVWDDRREYSYGPFGSEAEAILFEAGAALLDLESNNGRAPIIPVLRVCVEFFRQGRYQEMLEYASKCKGAGYYPLGRSPVALRLGISSLRQTEWNRIQAILAEAEQTQGDEQ